MKKKITLGCFLLTLFSGFVFQSCQDNEEINMSENKPVKLLNGVLSFQSQEDFDESISFLKNNQDKLQVWQSQFKGYVSLLDAYQGLLHDINEENADVEALLANNKHLYSITNRTGEREMIGITDDDLLATVFNKDGLVIVDGQIMKLTATVLYKKTFLGIEELANPNLTSAAYFIDADAEQIPVVKSIVLRDVATGRKIETCEKDYKTNGKKKRMRGEIFKNKIGPLFASVGARTKHQKKVLGVWVNNDTRKLRLKVDGTYSQESFGAIIELPINYDKTKSDDNKVSKTFEFCINANCKFDVVEMRNYHWCHCDDRVNRSCNTEI